MISLTPSVHRTYLAIVDATDNGATAYVGHFHIPGVDAGQISHELRTLTNLGVIECEVVRLRRRKGRRIRLLVKADMIETRETRRGGKVGVPLSRPPSASGPAYDSSPEDKIRTRHLATVEMKFAEAWQRAFPNGADYRRGVYGSGRGLLKLAYEAETAMRRT